MRAADADRDAVADALCAHGAAGRLDVPELEERLAAALAAGTLDELDHLLADLPGGRSAAPPASVGPATPAKAGFPGLRDFHQRHVVDGSRRATFQLALERIVPSMVRVGYDVAGRSEPHMLVFECREHPAWVPFACVLLFPIGLVSLAYRETQRVVVTFEELGPDQTRITVQGTARRPVRKAFAQLSRATPPR